MKAAAIALIAASTVVAQKPTTSDFPDCAKSCNPADFDLAHKFVDFLCPDEVSSSRVPISTSSTSKSETNSLGTTLTPSVSSGFATTTRKMSESVDTTGITSATNTTSGAATPGPATTKAGTDTQSSTSPSHPGGLSAGAKAGVGVGAAAGGVALLAGLAWFFFRWGQHASRNGYNDNSAVQADSTKPEATVPVVSELEGQGTGRPISEMVSGATGSSKAHAAELP
ncbi:hypothetical protein PWT90_05227 [Aphanocladium album]|nr:hypothetical protein PWT90_05227 [Aphanocladium album]